MAEYNLNLNVKVQADDIAAAYAAVSLVLSEVKNLGEITKVDLGEPKANGLPGHGPGCRMSKTRSASVCTCGPVPR